MSMTMTNYPIVQQIFTSHPYMWMYMRMFVASELGYWHITENVNWFLLGKSSSTAVPFRFDLVMWLTLANRKWVGVTISQFQTYVLRGILCFHPTFGEIMFLLREEYVLGRHCSFNLHPKMRLRTISIWQSWSRAFSNHQMHCTDWQLYDSFIHYSLNVLGQFYMHNVWW